MRAIPARVRTSAKNFVLPSVISSSAPDEVSVSFCVTACAKMRWPFADLDQVIAELRG